MPCFQISPSLPEGHFSAFIPVEYQMVTLVICICKDDTNFPFEYPTNTVYLVLTDPRVMDAAWAAYFSKKVVHLIHRLQDRVMMVSRRYYSVYVGQFKMGLKFPFLHLFISILTFFDIALSKLSPNAIRVIVAFEVHCSSVGVESSLELFHSFFSTKSSHIPYWFYFISRLNLKVALLSKNTNLKNKFLYFYVLSGISLCHV